VTTVQNIHRISYGPGNLSHFGGIQKRRVRFNVSVVPNLMNIDVAANYLPGRITNRDYLLALLRTLVMQQGKAAIDAIRHLVAFQNVQPR